jgi:hypothetical protein
MPVVPAACCALTFHCYYMRNLRVIGADRTVFLHRLSLAGLCIKGKGKGSPITGHEGPEGE